MHCINLKFCAYNLSEWFTELQSAVYKYRTQFTSSPHCLILGLDTLENISSLPDPPNCYVIRDVLGRITFIMHEQMVLDVLIDQLPDNEFQITDNPQSKSIKTSYQRILQSSIENLSKVRNQVLDQVVMLSLNGEMKDVQDLFQKEQIVVNYYTLDDFDRVTDENVSCLREIWYFLNDRILKLENIN